MILKQANAQYSAHPQTPLPTTKAGVNHVTSFGEMTSLVAFFPFYHSKHELAGRLMLVAEKSVPVHSGGEFQKLKLQSQ